MKGALEKKIVFYFFLSTSYLANTKKLQCFLQTTSQIFDIYDQTQISIINFWQFCIT